MYCALSHSLHCSLCSRNMKLTSWGLASAGSPPHEVFMDHHGCPLPWLHLGQQSPRVHSSTIVGQMEGNGGRGRPRKGWMDNIRENIDLKGISITISKYHLAMFGHIARLKDDVPAHQILHNQVGLSSGHRPDHSWKHLLGQPVPTEQHPSNLSLEMRCSQETGTWFQGCTKVHHWPQWTN